MKYRSMQGGQRDVEERFVGTPSNISRFGFCGPGEGGVLKYERNEKGSRLREPYAGQGLNHVVPCDGREASSAR